jgi:tetratricopeptide (TPR) repeat protein
LKGTDLKHSSCHIALSPAVLALLACAFSLCAQGDPIHASQQLMVRQKYAEAAAKVKEVLRQDPDNLDALYTLVTIEQTRILDYESYTIDGKEFIALSDSVRKVLDARLRLLKGEDSLRCLFYSANILGGVGLIQAKCGEWFSGARNAMGSVNLLRQIKKIDPENYGADLGIGAFDFYFGSSFKWIPFVSGNVERGIEAVERSLRAPFPFNHAAKSTYCWILIDRKEFKKADSIARSVLVELPGNTVFLRIRALIALWTGSYKDALPLGKKVVELSQNRTPVNWSDLVMGYYIIVKCHEHLGQKSEAYAAAQKALSIQIPAEYKNISHVKDNLKYISDTGSKYKAGNK